MPVRGLDAGAHFCRVIAILCVLLAPSQTVLASDSPPLNWRALRAPGGQVLYLASSSRPGGYVYAVTTAAVRRGPQNIPLATGDPMALSYGLYRRQTGGLRWEPAGNALPRGQIKGLGVDPLTDAVFITVQPTTDGPDATDELWKSRDGGLSWQKLALPQASVSTMGMVAAENGVLYVLAQAASTDQPTTYLFHSTDTGQSWAARAVVVDGQTVSDLRRLVSDGTPAGSLFAVGALGMVYASRNDGETWRPVAGLGEARGTVAAHVAGRADGAGVLFLVRGGVPGADQPITFWRSDDAGLSWTAQIGQGLPAESSVYGLIALDRDVLLLSSGAGAYRSQNNGLTWQALEGPLNSSQVSQWLALRHEQGSVLAATGYGVFSSADDGALWRRAGEGLPANSRLPGLLTHARRPNWIYAIMAGEVEPDRLSAPQVLASTDGGQTWTSAGAGLPRWTMHSWAIDPDDPDILYLGTSAGLYRTRDAGLRWERLPVPAEDTGIHAIAIAPAKPSVIYAGGQTVHYSRDSGTSWRSLAFEVGDSGPRPAGFVVGLVVDPHDAQRVWAAFAGGGVWESQDAGATWRSNGMDDKRPLWLKGATGPDGRFSLFTAVADDGLYVWQAPAQAASEKATWSPAGQGIPQRSTLIALLEDLRSPGTLWAARNGGGIYRSVDGALTWADVGAGSGDNLALALAVDYAVPAGVYVGMATSGLWALRAGVQASPAPAAVDARIEVVWPHEFAPVSDARAANIGLRLFGAKSLAPPPCGWAPEVTVWQAIDNEPALPLGIATQWRLNGQKTAYWELNDVDVRAANSPQHKLFFFVSVREVQTMTSVWAHGTDPRTYFPQQDVPSGIAIEGVDAVDTRIQIVWPHDGSGSARSVATGEFANVAVEVFKHGTRLSVPVTWKPNELTLHGAWNHEIGSPIANRPTLHIRQAGAITFPVWEFTNIPVVRATNSTDELYLWVVAEGLPTYPTIWSHGADARTNFPIVDEPVQGCMP